MDFHVVTGAFGYSGKYIAARLLAAGTRVRTLTNSPCRRNAFDGAVEAHPYNFDKPDELARSLEGARVLVNTYWVRFDHADFNHSQAVRNTLRLFQAAKRAGVARVEAELEAALRDSGLSHAILRPTVLFGNEDILINNIAWMLRRLPLFGVFGDGRYRLQPVFVDDLARLAVESAASRDNLLIDAIGPETFAYRDLVTVVGRAIGRERRIVGLPPGLGLAFGRLLGRIVGDVVITPEEVAGLMQNLLVTDSPPTGRTALSVWAVENRDSLGRRYSSELARRRDRNRSYQELRGSAGTARCLGAQLR
jgi:uncharacterized protein YbjT (DUF2867 family)